MGQMPGIDLEATAAIRQLANYGDVPLLALTANSSDEYRTLGRERGMEAFLPKPLQSEELLNTIARFLSSKLDRELQTAPARSRLRTQLLKRRHIASRRR
jgi:CheY-like chemotaxis protein